MASPFPVSNLPLSYTHECIGNKLPNLTNINISVRSCTHTFQICIHQQTCHLLSLLAEVSTTPEFIICKWTKPPGDEIQQHSWFLRLYPEALATLERTIRKWVCNHRKIKITNKLQEYSQSNNTNSIADRTTWWWSRATVSLYKPLC